MPEGREIVRVLIKFSEFAWTSNVMEIQREYSHETFNPIYFNLNFTTSAINHIIPIQPLQLKWFYIPNAFNSDMQSADWTNMKTLCNVIDLIQFKSM